MSTCTDPSLSQTLDSQRRRHRNQRSDNVRFTFCEVPRQPRFVGESELSPTPIGARGGDTISRRVPCLIVSVSSGCLGLAFSGVHQLSNPVTQACCAACPRRTIDELDSIEDRLAQANKPGHVFSPLEQRLVDNLGHLYSVLRDAPQRAAAAITEMKRHTSQSRRLPGNKPRFATAESRHTLSVHCPWPSCASPARSPGPKPV